MRLSPPAVTLALFLGPSLFESHLPPLFPLREALLSLAAAPAFAACRHTSRIPRLFSLSLIFKATVSFVVLVALRRRLVAPSPQRSSLATEGNYPS